MLRKKIAKNLNLNRLKYLPTNISKLYFSIPKIILKYFSNMIGGIYQALGIEDMRKRL